MSRNPFGKRPGITSPLGRNDRQDAMARAAQGTRFDQSDAGRTGGTRFRSEPRPPRKPRKPSRVARLVGGWWDRLIGAVYSGSLSSQTEQYAAHETTRDYI